MIASTIGQDGAGQHPSGNRQWTTGNFNTAARSYATKKEAYISNLYAYHMHTAVYINSFVFDYVETWSFNRGAEEKQMDAEYKQAGLIKDFEERQAAYRALSKKYFLLINDAGQLHPFAKKINTFKSDHPFADRIKQILQTAIEEKFNFLCEPVYRDALVFYDYNNKVVSVLNICFSCMHMYAAPHNELKADYKTYDWLKTLLLEIGHNIEKPEYSIIADVERMKQKFRKK
jgi:hypothetical protein